jgi:hypothetical protein
VQNVKRTHGSEGATELGQDEPGRVGPGQPARPIPVSVRPPFLEREDDATLRTWTHHHSQKESHSPERPSTI